MLNKIKKQSDGFTIIEVMIVLAIAALILLIVLLAVPALQRNSRNTAIKNDASTVAGGITTYESDNGGKPPTYISGTGTVSIGTSSSDPNIETVKVQGGTLVKTGAASDADVGNVIVLKGKDCDGNVSSRAYSVYYTTETSGGNHTQCLTT